jgi:hypothetical protein
LLLLPFCQSGSWQTSLSLPRAFYLVLEVARVSFFDRPTVTLKQKTHHAIQPFFGQAANR